ncbi:MAG: GDYXXLXY domain-containing protein [Rhodothermales bacterium]
MRRRSPARWQTWTFFTATMLALAVPSLLIVQGERMLRYGEPMLLPLDVSGDKMIIQGRYVRLSYPLLTGFAAGEPAPPRSGLLAVKLDSNRVGTEVRYFGEGDELSPQERILRYRTCVDHLCVGAEAFFIEQDQADYYRQARYAELRVGSRGQVLLAGVRDSARNPLPGPP